MNWFLLSLVLLELLFTVAEYFQGLPFHDGFYVLSNQYYLLNGLYQNGEFPLWSPVMTHGTPTGNGYLLSSGGFLFKTLTIWPSIVKFGSFPFWFWAGFFVDRLVLLIGVWLLSGRFFNNDLARFFTTFTVTTSVILYLQPCFTFYILYCVPLILYLIHRFLEEGQGKWLCWAILISAVQIVGNLLYYLPVHMLVVSLYVAALFVFGVFPIGRLKVFSSRGVLFAGAVAAPLLFLLHILVREALDAGNIHFFADRAADGTVPLQTFLTYGGRLGLSKWNELWLKLSPFADYALYIGILCLPLIIVGSFWSRNKFRKPVLFVTLFLILFSIGGMVAQFLYHVWPLMKIYRHLGQLSNLIKMFLAILAGFGIEYLLCATRDRRWKAAVIVSAASLFTVAAALIAVVFSSGFRGHAFRGLENPGLAASAVPFIELGPALFPLIVTVLMLAAGLLTMVIVLNHGQRTKVGWVLLMAVIGIHLFDLSSYRAGEMRKRLSTSLEEAGTAVHFRQLSYEPRRGAVADCENHRKLMVSSNLGAGMTYTMNQNLTFCDPVNLAYKTSYVSAAFFDVMRAFERPFTLNGAAPMARFRDAVIPSRLPEALKAASAYSSDKVQFFSDARPMNLADQQAFVKSADFKGHELLVHGPLTRQRADSPQSRRLDVPYSVALYTPNEVVIRLAEPAASASWLYYSDAWHPRWKAEVNGRPVPVYRANVGYKAVELRPGDVEVRFYFEQPVLALLIRVFGVLSAICLGFVLFAVGQAFRGRSL